MKNIWLLFFLFFHIEAFAFENLVYTWRGFPDHLRAGNIALADLKQHAKQIDIYSSEAYHITKTGQVIGALNARMLAVAEVANIKVMPLVGNTDFDRKNTRIFLHDTAAQERAIKTILKLCQNNHFYGVQIDFEGMSLEDRAAFSQFYIHVANTLHAQGFKVSIAIIPTITDLHTATEYLERRDKYWSGVYDYKVLAHHSDFITLMTYDQHGAPTTPGPMAGNAWSEAIIRYALNYIPANKISLGIPLHSGYWYTGSESADELIHSIGTTITFQKAREIINANNLHVTWNNTDKIHSAMYLHHYLYEYLFLEDAASFKEKVALVNQYHLRGLSNWCLGEEDPEIWRYVKRIR
jgi:spore germination protein